MNNYCGKELDGGSPCDGPAGHIGDCLDVPPLVTRQQWPQGVPGEQGCPRCGCWLGSQDGEHPLFCPNDYCGWIGGEWSVQPRRLRLEEIARRAQNRRHAIRWAVYRKAAMLWDAIVAAAQAVRLELAIRWVHLRAEWRNRLD